MVQYNVGSCLLFACAIVFVVVVLKQLSADQAQFAFVIEDPSGLGNIELSVVKVVGEEARSSFFLRLQEGCCGEGVGKVKDSFSIVC